MGHGAGSIVRHDFQSALRGEGIVRGLGSQGCVRCGELYPGLLPVAPPGLKAAAFVLLLGDVLSHPSCA